MKLQGLIELHSHILPQLDDGSRSVPMSLEMLRRETEQGVGTVCVTPHYHSGRESVPAFCERRKAALAKLLNELPEDLPQIIPAAEAAFFSGISESPLVERLCIQGTRTLLLEMPFGDWNDIQIGEVATLVLDRCFHVVLVHPERFCFSGSNRRALGRLAQLPISFQVNADSLIHWGTRRLALELLELAPDPLLGSDCHNLTSRPPNLMEGRAVVRKKMGKAFLDQMDDNAVRAVQEWE